MIEVLTVELHPGTDIVDQLGLGLGGHDRLVVPGAPCLPLDDVDRMEWLTPQQGLVQGPVECAGLSPGAVDTDLDHGVDDFG